MSFNEEFRYGSARHATEEEIRRAGLFGRCGYPIGYVRNRLLRLDDPAPAITVAGSGTGKLRDIGAYYAVEGNSNRLILDPKGEQAAISINNLIRARAFGYCWNPKKLFPGRLCYHRTNLLDVLTPGNLSFHADVKLVVAALIPIASDKSRYWSLKARSWVGAIIKSRAERLGVTSIPDLTRILNMIEGDRAAWAEELRAMQRSRFDDVRRTAGEMLTKQLDAVAEFSGIMGEVYANLGFDDPMLMESLEESDFSLETLCSSSQPVTVYLNVPAEYLGLWSPILRLFFLVAMLYKRRHPEAPRLNLYLDEAGQLGAFEELLKCFTYGRGEGIRAWAIFQDLGQITRNFGPSAIQTFLGSAQIRQFFGVRDYETARLISHMLGEETLSYADPLAQDAARRQKWAAWRSVMEGQDPFAAAYEYTHFERAAQNRMKQSRPLMTPDEILSMREDQQILFISGRNLHPVAANKYPIWTSRRMAGQSDANPLYHPADRVRVRTIWGERWADVIEEPVPPEFAHYPQYQNLPFRYVEGYRSV